MMLDGFFGRARIRFPIDDLNHPTLIQQLINSTLNHISFYRKKKLDLHFTLCNNQRFNLATLCSLKKFNCLSFDFLNFINPQNQGLLFAQFCQRQTYLRIHHLVNPNKLLILF